MFRKKKKTQKIGIIALYFRLTSAFAVNRVRPRRRDFSLQLAHRENQCSPDLCAENDARRDRCVAFFFKAGHAGRATAGKSRRLNSICARRCRYCCTVRRRGDVISPRTGEGHGGSSGCFGPGSSSSRFCRCVSDFTSALKFMRLKYKTSSVSQLHSDLIEPHTRQFLGHLFIWQLVIVNY